MLSKIPVKDYIEEFLLKEEYDISTTLCAIMTSFGSDKGDQRHNYTTLYSKLFHPWKNEAVNLFELGVGTNFDTFLLVWVPKGMRASLYGWSLFFPKGSIYGADIDKRILFNDQNIKTYYCNQLDAESIQALFSNEDLKNISFDIIIEDGLHEFDANLSFLLNSIHKLKKDGIYITEDLDAVSRASFKQVLPLLKESLNLQYIDVLEIPFHLNRFDNALLIIQK